MADGELCTAESSSLVQTGEIDLRDISSNQISGINMIDDSVRVDGTLTWAIH